MIPPIVSSSYTTSPNRTINDDGSFLIIIILMGLVFICVITPVLCACVRLWKRPPILSSYEPIFLTSLERAERAMPRRSTPRPDLV